MVSDFCGHIALAPWADLRAMQAAPFSLFIEYYSVLVLGFLLPTRKSQYAAEAFFIFGITFVDIIMIVAEGSSISAFHESP